MKFAKRLAELAHPDYKQYYLNYVELKRVVKILQTEGLTVEEVTKLQGSGPAIGPDVRSGAECLFQDLAAMELRKIDSFATLLQQGIYSKLNIVKTIWKTPTMPEGERATRPLGFIFLGFIEK